MIARGKAGERTVNLWRWAAEDLLGGHSAKRTCCWASLGRQRRRLSDPQLKPQKKPQGGYG